MKLTLTAAQAKALDKKAQKQFGIPALLLMENAARAVAAETFSILKKQKGRAAIFCGKGFNGADGLCAARHLLTAGIKSDVFLAGKRSELANEAKVNLDILFRLQQKVIQVDKRNLRLIKRKISRYAIIVDALLGVGLKGEVQGLYRDLIELINNSNVSVLSIDIPSGLDATTGKALGICIKADRTITFVAKKRGMVVGLGPSVCGRVVIAGLGVPL